MGELLDENVVPISENAIHGKSDLVIGSPHRINRVLPGRTRVLFPPLLETVENFLLSVVSYLV